MAEDYGSRQEFKEAGFFDDGLDFELDDDCYTNLNWLTTPYHKILRRLPQLDEYDPAQLAAYPPIVLVTTGGFSPIHNGHIDMMELAKNEMVQRGHVVLGGYLSPSHDSYVSTKHGGAASLMDEHRIRLCHEAVAMNEWLMVDPWEARYLPCAVNYTDVILRLENYLNFHLRPLVRLRVGYVFGGDNAAFARAFLRTGYAVCVERPGHEAAVAKIKGEIAGRASRVAIARPRLEYFDISSSGIRSDESAAMPERSSRYYCALRDNLARAAQPIQKRRYLIRDESEWAVAPWRDEEFGEQVIDAAGALRDTLHAALITACGRAPLPDRALSLQVEVPTLSRQAEYAQALQETTETITLDACTEGTYCLKVSHLFGLADGQCFSTQIMPRPGSLPITEQIQNVPPGEYTLLDDDIASGQTMRMMMAVFPEGIRISRILSLLEQTRKIDSFSVDQIDYQDFYDVVDFRDFLVGSRNGGLVVRLPNRQIVRVPYMAPYVTLNTRIRLPASQEIPFALEMWRANERFFASTGRTILVGECDPASQELMTYLGFTPKSPVLEVVRWHLHLLQKTTTRRN
jgi:nicotinic acid mononucleotide adenylyltransferase